MQSCTKSIALCPFTQFHLRWTLYHVGILSTNMLSVVNPIVLDCLSNVDGWLTTIYVTQVYLSAYKLFLPFVAVDGRSILILILRSFLRSSPVFHH